MGATTWQRLTRVLVPAAIPTVLSGLRLGGALTIVGVVVSEMLVASQGIGYLISFYRQSLDGPHIYAGILLVLLLAVGFDAHRAGARAQERGLAPGEPSRGAEIDAAPARDERRVRVTGDRSALQARRARYRGPRPSRAAWHRRHRAADISCRNPAPRPGAPARYGSSASRSLRDDLRRLDRVILQVDARHTSPACPAARRASRDRAAAAPPRSRSASRGSRSAARGNGRCRASRP